MIGIPVSDSLPYLCPRFLTDGGGKVQEHLSVYIYRTSGSECITQKIKLYALIGNITMIPLAINNLRLFFVEFQLAFAKPFPDGSFYKLCLFQAYTVAYRIVGVSFK
jgi:hypothetical protein